MKVPIIEARKLTNNNKTIPITSMQLLLNRKFINLIPNFFSMVGNIPNFTKMDILRCFLRFSKNVGRQELSRELELGEGTVRTILDALKSKKLLDSTKKGHFLSKKGEEALKHISSHVSLPKIINTGLYPGFKKAGVHVKNVSNLKEIYKLRDMAVKNGAEGAIILKFEGKLYAPEADYEYNYRGLERNFELKNNDVLVIGFSGEKRSAENGALAVAIELDNALKSFITEF